MTLALLDCPTGLAGNMLLAALLDLGLPPEVIAAPLAVLGLEGRYRLRIEERRSAGLRGLHLAVEALEPQPHHRPWGALRRLLQDAPLEPALQQKVLAVFGLLAEAEAAVHGHAAEAVEFHEVGAIDALVDIVGVCAGLLHLGVEQLVCGVPPAGHGRVVTAHGALPLPAPAVLEIARSRGLPLASSEGFPAGELFSFFFRPRRGRRHRLFFALSDILVGGNFVFQVLVLVLYVQSALPLRLFQALDLSLHVLNRQRRLDHVPFLRTQRGGI